MGNKSKQRSNPGKWKSVRKTNEARQVNRGQTFFGVTAPTHEAPMSTVGIAATDKDRAHPFRQLHGHAKGPVLFSGGTAIREKKPLPEVNRSPQPWQKDGARQERRLAKKPHLHPLARRQAREQRKAVELARAA